MAMICLGKPAKGVKDGMDDDIETVEGGDSSNAMLLSINAIKECRKGIIDKDDARGKDASNLSKVVARQQWGGSELKKMVSQRSRVRWVEQRRLSASFLQMVETGEATISSHMDLGTTNMLWLVVNCFNVLALATSILVTMLDWRKKEIKKPMICNSIGSLWEKEEPEQGIDSFNYSGLSSGLNLESGSSYA